MNKRKRVATQKHRAKARKFRERAHAKRATTPSTSRTPTK
jgi:hypothetical protein